MRVTTLFLVACFLVPAPAKAAINPAEVANCLSKNSAQPDRCLPVVFTPCAQLAPDQQGPCLRAITFEWLRLSELRTQKLLRDRNMARSGVNHKPLTNEMLMDVPGCEVSSFREGVIDTRNIGLSSRLCTLLAAARTWHVVEANPDAAVEVFRTFAVNRDGMKTCVRVEAGNASRKCIGRISDPCADLFPRRLCDDREAIVWEAILTDSYVALGADLSKALLSADQVPAVDARTCAADFTKCARALRDQNARRAILLYLALDLN